MSEKCAYVKFMLKKCQRETKKCHIHKKILEDCMLGKIYYTGCSKEYKPTKEQVQVIYK